MDWQELTALASDWTEKIVRLSPISRAILFSVLNGASFYNVGTEIDAADAAIALVIDELLTDYEEPETPNMTYATVYETRENGADCGGTIGDSTWRTRAVDFILNDDIGLSLSSGGIVVPSGVYFAVLNCPFIVGSTTGKWVRTSLRNASGGKYLQSGNYYVNAASIGFIVPASGTFTLYSPATMYVAYNTNDTRANNGLGRATGIANELEFYSCVSFVKIGDAIP